VRVEDSVARPAGDPATGAVQAVSLVADTSLDKHVMHTLSLQYARGNQRETAPEEGGRFLRLYMHTKGFFDVAFSVWRLRVKGYPSKRNAARKCREADKIADDRPRFS